jgi:hypothetical protein
MPRPRCSASSAVTRIGRRVDPQVRRSWRDPERGSAAKKLILVPRVASEHSEGPRNLSGFRGLRGGSGDRI